ncbi:MAG: primosomal protein DnaI [Bacilli bacterium]|nr:primosomal protein DnaI [Bacilli bacterium]
METKPKFKKLSKEELTELLFEDPVLSNFFIDNDLNPEYIEENIPRFLSFITEKDHCIACQGLNSCKQDNVGLEPLLSFEDNKIKFIYRECGFMVNKHQIDRKNQLIDAMYMPQMILKADLEDYKTDTENRMEIYRYMMKFINLYSRGDKVKGMYLYGQYQQGKTYTLAALANELTKKGYRVIIAYYPDLVREIKSSIGNHTLEALIAKLKKADILMLDDIGGENQSSWIRDEVLGPILQHRLLDELPTFFSSNVSRKELPMYMVENQQKAEMMKAYRIHARIETLTEEYKM